MFFTSCGSLTEFKMLNCEIEGVKYKIKVPKGYELYEYSTIEENMVQLNYSDSSCIYCGSPDMTPNKRNIKSVNDSIYSLRFQNILLAEDVNKSLGFKLITIRPDTLDIAGQDSVGLLWRDVIIRDICVGYKNVKKSNKLLFDNAINSLRWLLLVYKIMVINNLVFILLYMKSQWKWMQAEMGRGELTICL